ncbi:MAG TPA: hypothetical protein VFT41_04245 [Gemmatimonadaceae bacterium]|nr:hypothetical protein [Gemmatimonadaceae bacterium]
MDRVALTTLYHVLAVTGPGLTALGAGLLAYDVMRGPLRLDFRRQHAGRLDAEAAIRDESARPFASARGGYSTEEREVAVAGIHRRFEHAVGQVKDRFDEAAKREYDRAFYLGVAGLVLVGLGGICETTAAALEWAAHVR